MSNKAAPDGLSFREFGRRDGCSEALVRRRVRAGYLPTLPNGRISEAYVGTAWRASASPGAKPVSSVRASEIGVPGEDETRAPRKGAAAQPEGPPPWLQPVHDCGDPFSKGTLFGILHMAREIQALGAITAVEAGAPIAIAKLAGQFLVVAFVERATDFMLENKIGPFEQNDDPPIWRPSVDVSLCVDWKRVAEDAGEPYEPKKWNAYAKKRKALSLESEALENAEAPSGKKRRRTQSLPRLEIAHDDSRRRPSR